MVERGGGGSGKSIVTQETAGYADTPPIPARTTAPRSWGDQAGSRQGSLYSADEWKAYATLRLRGDDGVIRKEKGRPVGRGHGIEAFWS